MADVYDAPAWQKFMGPATFPVNRIGLQFCIDAIPAFIEGSYSVKPGAISNFSLPPEERFKPKNMLLVIVIPTDIKDPNVKKYYDFMAEYELNELFHTGIDGVKIKIYSSSMDTPGRSELMGKCVAVRILVVVFIYYKKIFISGMESALAYQGCPACTHTWSKGSIVGQTACIYDGYRRFLPQGSRARRRRFRHGGFVYEYRFALRFCLLCV